MIAAPEKAETALLWSMMSGHTLDRIRPVADYTPIIERMFPGVIYYGNSGFYQVMRELACPAIKQTFKELAACSTVEAAIEKFGTEMPVPVIKSSKAYEWHTDPKWREDFNKQLNLG